MELDRAVLGPTCPPGLETSPAAATRLEKTGSRTAAALVKGPKAGSWQHTTQAFGFRIHISHGLVGLSFYIFKAVTLGTLLFPPKALFFLMEKNNFFSMPNFLLVSYY